MSRDVSKCRRESWLWFDTMMISRKLTGLVCRDWFSEGNGAVLYIISYSCLQGSRPAWAKGYKIKISIGFSTRCSQRIRGSKLGVGLSRASWHCWREIGIDLAP